MKILQVIPIARGISKEVLSYFSAQGAPRGSIVFVPLRNREVPGLVLHESDAHALKNEVRGLHFEIKKANTKRSISLFSPALISAGEKTASFHATATGAVLSALLNAKLLASVRLLKLPSRRFENDSTHPRTVADILIFQAEEEERLSRYKSIIRECFARHESVFIAAPTLIDAERLAEHLGRGIEDYTFVFHGNLAGVEMARRLKKVFATSHPVLIVGTPSFICIERPDVRTIIVERENSASFKLQSRPYLDFRYLIEAYAKERGVRLILGGLPLRIETLARFETHELNELTTPAFRLLQGAENSIIDMRTKQESTRTFEVLSPPLKELLQKTIDENDHALLFVARRGLAPLTICQDCGSVVKASDGETPMALHTGPRGNIFVSHVTGEMRDAHERCKTCNSWRLQELGIGIERVESEVKKYFPTARIIRIDQDTARTPKQIHDLVTTFYATPGSILICTERALAYLGEKIAYTGVVSIDTLLSLPEWKISERIFSILLKLRGITNKKYLLQTRNPLAPLLSHALSGNIADFMRGEIEKRKMLGYPPFTILIKCSIVGTINHVSDSMRALLSTFEHYGLEPYPAPLALGRNRYVFHALMKLEPELWPELEVLAKIAALPPHVAVDVNPETLH